MIIPIYNEVKAIIAGLNTIEEVSKFNKNIIVVATKLQRRGKQDRFKKWENCEDIQNIKKAVASIDKKIPVTPLKFSAVFDTIFEKEKSIKQLMKDSPLNKYHYKDVYSQFNELYNLIDTHA